MSMHSDQINPDSHDNDENQSPNLIDQFFIFACVEIPSDFRSGFVAIVGSVAGCVAEFAPPAPVAGKDGPDEKNQA